MFERLEDSGTIVVGEIELPRGAFREVVVDDTVDFCPERLSLSWSRSLRPHICIFLIWESRQWGRRQLLYP